MNARRPSRRISDHPTASSGNLAKVDGVPEFYVEHNLRFPDFVGAELAPEIDWLGMQHVLQFGGSGYFPVCLVQPHPQEGQTAPVTDAPAAAGFPHAFRRLGAWPALCTGIDMCRGCRGS